MRRLRLALAAIAAACLLVLGGCSAVEQAAEKMGEVHGYVHTLKEQGCEALPAPAQKVLVEVIKSRVEFYPENGICNPNWVRDVLVEKLKGLEVEGGVHNESEDLGYSAGGGNGYLVKSDGVGVLFTGAEAAGESASWVSDGSGFNTEVGALIHAPGFKVYSGSGGGSRLLLHGSLPVYEPGAGGSDLAGSDGACSDACAYVEALRGMGGGSSGWSGWLVV